MSFHVDIAFSMESQLVILRIPFVFDCLRLPFFSAASRLNSSLNDLSLLQILYLHKHISLQLILILSDCKPPRK